MRESRQVHGEAIGRFTATMIEQIVKRERKRLDDKH
jgi:hypothetical protein